VQSNLQLSEVPLANTGRYDSLCAMVDTDKDTNALVEVDHAV
jgi:hypothetical protein